MTNSARPGAPVPAASAPAAASALASAVPAPSDPAAASALASAVPAPSDPAAAPSDPAAAPSDPAAAPSDPAGGGEDQRLHELAERYFWLFEDSPVAKYVCDVEGTVLEVNSAMSRLLGVRPDELVGRTLASFSVDPPVPAAELERFLRGQARTYSGVRTYRAADGRPRRTSVTLGAIRDANGAARTIFGELEDLTVHELALSELDRQRHRLEMAIEASNIAVSGTRRGLGPGNCAGPPAGRGRLP